ncbi:MAG: filamentous hemagglutinin N-terminal domain-containing protein, partial [Roseateles sp.]
MKNNSLNCAYRLVWNDAAQCYQPVPETARGRGKSGRSARVLALACASLFGAAAWAGPTGGTVSAGSGSISQQGSQTTITQTSQHLAINWAGFSIGAQERVNFVQPGSGAIALNRVTGSEVSVINGALNANGQIWILNSNGLLFGKTASVNVGGLVASTLSLSDADFMAGKSRFTADGSQGRVVNQGSLSGGYVALLGQQVSNSGTIKTPGGTSALAAGDAITLSFSGNRLLSVQVDAGTYQALAENSGLIQADDGTVLMSASAKDALLDTVVNNTGIIEARGISTNGGRIELMGGFNGGTVKVGGTLDASSTTHDGGFIETSGAHVQIGEGARISTLSAGGKTGTWLVDPTDFTISAGSDAGTTSGIGASTLATQLASSNVTLATDASGSDVGNINVNAAVSWSANTTLTLNAYNNININAALTATGASAGLVLNYGDYATAGSARTGTNYNIAAPVTLSGASASLSVNNLAYTLVRSMSQLDTLDNASGRYALAQDLDASGTTYSAAVLGGNFRGTFAGLGHTISDLTISAGSDMYVGLFSLSSGSIRDLGLSSASVSGGAYVGGLVGQSTGSISNVYATGSVTGSSNVGGLVGSASAGSISNAYATGSVTGTTFVGGLVGSNVGSISNVYATSSVTGNGPVGGLAGTNSGSISNAYATGRVTGANVVNAGGLVGSNTGASSSISNAYWDSASTGRIKDIGIRLAGTFTNLSAVTSSTAYNHSSYANLGTWTETVSGSGVWVAANGSGVKQWVMIEGASRPFLYSEYSTSVGNAHQLQLMAYDPSASYTLSRNIDASETVGSNASGLWTSSGFAPVGNSSAQFSGSLDGAGHTINQLSIDRSNGLYVGLFGFGNGNGSISDLGLVGGSVSGGNYVGGLIGYSSGSLSKVYSTGSVMGNGWFVGGLVGSNDGSVSNAYTTGNVSNVWQYTGGLVGYNNNTASIRDAYATGDVTGSGSNGGYVGGLVGYNV